MPVNPPFRAGGVGKAVILPNKFVPPGVTKTKASSSTATTHNNSSSGDNSSGNSGHGAPLSDEQRLNLAYSKYLQSQATLLLVQKMQEVKHMGKELDCLKATLKSEYAKGFIRINSESSLYYNRILILKRLLQTNDFMNLYTSLETKFLEESCTMGELQKALGAKLDQLEVHNLEGCGDIEETEMDIDDLIQQVKRNLSPDDLTKKDGKSFLLMFTQALRTVITDAGKIEKEKMDGAAVDSGLLKLNSMKLSDRMVLRTEDRET